MEHNREFDRIIKEHLENLQPDFSPESWDLLEQKLDASGAGAPETEAEEFDQVIKGNLLNLQPKFSPESWDLLEQKLDADGVGVPEAKAEDFDEIVFTKLHQLETPYQPGHWNAMYNSGLPCYHSSMGLQYYLSVSRPWYTHLFLNDS